MKSEAREGIRPIISKLLESGVLRECLDSLCNTPLFPVKKLNKENEWRLVQDLQRVNSAVIPRAPTTPDPHTLLNSISPAAQWFTVIDLANAFFFLFQCTLIYNFGLHLPMKEKDTLILAAHKASWKALPYSRK